MLAAVLLFELVFLPEAIPGTPCFRDLHTFRDVMFQLPASRTTVTGDFFLTIRKTFAAVKYPAVWLAGLAYAVPFGCTSFFSLALFNEPPFDGLLQISPSPFRICSRWSTGGCIISTRRRRGCFTSPC